MNDIGILGAASYVPAARLSRQAIARAHAWANPALSAEARGTRSYGFWDEDSITMAVEAARACLKAAKDVTPERLVFASTTASFLDRANSAVVAEAAGLGPMIATLDSAGSLRAATSALRDALEGRRRTLLVASDQRPAKPASLQEMRYGDGAAAVLVGEGPVIARYLGGASRVVDLVDHYRTVESRTDYALEERWVRDEGISKIVPAAIRDALAAASLQASDIAMVAAPFAPRLMSPALKAAGLDQVPLADPLFNAIGDTGAPHPILMLCDVLQRAEPGTRILVIGFGQGVDALVFEVTDEVRNRRPAPAVEAWEADDNYLRFLSFRGEIRLDWGMRAERDNRTALSTFFRKRQAVTGFVGGHCTACGMHQFPKSRACVECGAIDTQEDYSFADSVGRIKTFTEDWQAYTPAPPLVYGNVAFAEGGNLLMEITDFQGGISVGQKVRMVFRIKDVDDRRGFRRYFWKAVAMAGEA